MAGNLSPDSVPAAQAKRVKFRSEVISEIEREIVNFEQVQRLYLKHKGESLPERRRRNWQLTKQSSGGGASPQVFMFFADLVAEVFGWQATYAELSHDPSSLPETASDLLAGYTSDNKSRPSFLPPNLPPGAHYPQVVGLDDKTRAEEGPIPIPNNGPAESDGESRRAISQSTQTDLPAGRVYHFHSLGMGILLAASILFLAGWVWSHTELQRTRASWETLTEEHGRLQTAHHQLNSSHSILTRENASLRSIEHPLKLIETRGLDKAPDAIGFFSEYLHRYEPEIFYQAEDGFYDVARIIANRDALGKESNFVAEFSGAKQSFDLFANTAGMFKEHLSVVEEGLRQGIQYRLVLSDYRAENVRLDQFLQDVNEGGGEPARQIIRVHHQHLDSLLERIRQDQAGNSRSEFKGSLEIRWNPKSLLYTMWIRDRGLPEAIAHLGVHYYSGKPQWPCFRISNKTSPGMIESLTAEFNYLWENSLPYKTIPVSL